MKNKIILLVFSAVCFTPVHSQITTIVLKPNAAEGKDAAICNSSSWNGGDPLSIKNFGQQYYLRNESWTAFANGSPEHDFWSLIEFEALDTMQYIEVISATLKLFELPNNTWANGGQYGDNHSELFRITEAWEELEVTWDTQPLYDPSSSIYIPSNNDYESITVDVTDWVRDMIENPLNNFGFLLRPSSIEPYRSMTFSSSDHDSESQWPELIITFENSEPEICHFEFPNVFTPDGNGLNDRFALVTNCPDSVSVRLYIYNRWGGQVFASDNALDGWDGYKLGKAMAADVYIYRAAVVMDDIEKVLEGDFTLLR